MSETTGLGGTVPRECHGCVERDHEIDRLRKVLDMAADGADDRAEAQIAAFAAMLAEEPRHPFYQGLPGSGCAGSARWLIEPSPEEPLAVYQERLVKAGLEAYKEKVG